MCTTAGGIIISSGLAAEASVRKSPLVFFDHGEATATLLTADRGGPRALLALFPGCNGDGARVYLGPGSAWTEFAHRHGVALLAVTLRSVAAAGLSGQGYYYPERGSGEAFIQLLADAEQAYPRLHDLPLYLHGFSGGAHFAHRFAQWKPGRVAGFCAYSAGWWQRPSAEVAQVPALILCGYQDERFDATLSYFQAGRRLGAAWTFARVRHTGHEVPLRATALMQAWLTQIMEPRSPTETTWRAHLYREETAPGWPAKDAEGWSVTSTAWLPNAAFAHAWRSFHHQQSKPPSNP